MATLHVYFGIENIALTNPQRQTLVSGLQSLGQDNNSGNPAERNHWRLRTDNNAIIFEARFDEDTLTIAIIKARLAAIFAVNVSLISHSTQQSAYGLVVTYTYNSISRVRSVAFGYNGNWPDRTTSGNAVRTYLVTNSAAWET